MKILLADPDEYYHTQLVERLGHLGEFVVTTEAQEARRILSQTPPDFLITELLLADSSGYEILEDVQKVAVEKRFPVIVFSKIDNLEDIETALNLGVNAYFVKGKDDIQEIHKLILAYNNAR